MKKSVNFSDDMIRAVLLEKKIGICTRVFWPVISKSNRTKKQMYFPNDVDRMNEILSTRERSPFLDPGPPFCGIGSFGQVGDRIYVRETFCLEHQVESGQPPPFDDGRPIRYFRDGIPYSKESSGMWVQPRYRATDPEQELSYDDSDGEPTVRWKSPVIMPKWASRITLDITGIRIQKKEEVVAEGFLPCAVVDGIYGFPKASAEASDSLIEKIFPRKSNPWVWCVTFIPFIGVDESI